MSQSFLNVLDFGAVGDGQVDDTAAFQKALDAAGEIRGGVHVPPGEYALSRLKVHSQTALVGDPTWSYRAPGGAVLRLVDRQAPCLLDLTNSVGVTLDGLSLAGWLTWGDLDHPDRLGGACGILFGQEQQNREEDMCRIERCRVCNFPGEAIRMRFIWCWTVRHCHLFGNGGHGIWAEGFDGFALDNWISGNAGAGIYTARCGACTTITGNRIEWNRQGGVNLTGCKHYQLTGNFIDRSGGPGIWLRSSEQRTSEVFAITGNIIWRSGRPEWTGPDGHQSSQVLFEDTWGIAFTGNSLNVWRDDGPRGRFSPRFGIVYRHLESSVIKDNALHDGALEQLVVDLGGHGPGVIVGDNPGRLFDPKAHG